MTGIWNSELAVCAGWDESVTVTVNDEVPTVVGVPLMPPSRNVRPSGSVPCAVNVYGPFPPEAVNVCVG